MSRLHDFMKENPRGLIKMDRRNVYDVVRFLSESFNGHLPEEELQRMQSKIFKGLIGLKIALIVVDFQNDFIDGPLSVQCGSAEEDPMEAIPLINALISDCAIDMVLFTQDWHPTNHISFVECVADSDRKLVHSIRVTDLQPFDLVEFKDPPLEQILFPSHCVQHSLGAEIHAGIRIPDGAEFIKKGTSVYVDSSSAFIDNNGNSLRELEEKLRSRGINAVLGCGLAYDICVRRTLCDSNQLGFLTGVIRDCSKGFSRERVKETTRYFVTSNIPVLDANMTRQIISRKVVPIEWIARLIELSKDKPVRK